MASSSSAPSASVPPASSVTGTILMAMRSTPPGPSISVPPEAKSLEEELSTVSYPHTYPGLSLEVTVHLDPANVYEFLTHFRRCFENVIEEPECTFFEVFIDPMRPGVIHWVEGWSHDPMWLMNIQLLKAYYQPYLKATEHMFIEPREVRLYERLPQQWSHIKPLHFARQ